MKRNRLAVTILVLLVLAAGVLGAVVLQSADGDTPAVVGATPPTSPPSSTTDVTPSPSPPSSGDPGSGTAPRFFEGRCRFDVPFGYQPLCGWLSVPENRAREDGREVRLHVAVFESPIADGTPIVYLDGGPGGETLDTLFFTFDTVWAPLLDHGDLVFFDQRGVGQSEPPLDCPEELEVTYETIGLDLDPEEFISLELAATRDCRDRLIGEGVDLGAYHSAASAADVADLRRSLGYEEWNILGISYGSRLAQTVLRDHPEGVRAAILDSTYPVDANLLIEAPRNLDRAFDHLFAACAADGPCAGAYPDLRERVFALAARLDGDPITITVRDYLSGEQYQARLTGPTLLVTMFQALYSDPLFPQLPAMIAELEEGTTSIASLLMSNNLTQVAFSSYGMHLSVQCHEELPFASVDEIAAGLVGYEEYADLFAYAVNLSVPMFEVCDVWGAGTASPRENEAVTSDVPTLVMAGSFDPITPPRWGREVAANLENSFFVEFPTLGHGTSIAGECPIGIVLDFLADPTVPPDTSCIAAMDPVPFVPAPFDPGSIVLELFEQDFFGLTVSGVFPADWEEVQPGAWSRGSTGIDQTAIVQQAVEAPGLGDEFVLGLFAEQFGIDGSFSFDREIDSPGGPWQVSTGRFETFVVDVALRRTGSILGAVVLVSEEDERDVLIQAVLEPALEAFMVS